MEDKAIFGFQSLYSTDTDGETDVEEEVTRITRLEWLGLY